MSAELHVDDGTARPGSALRDGAPDASAARPNVSGDLPTVFQAAPMFRRAVAGYDRFQVDTYVQWAEDELATADREREHLVARHLRTRAELEEARELLAHSAGGGEFLRLSRRIGSMLAAAADEAAGMRAEAEADRSAAAAQAERSSPTRDGGSPTPRPRRNGWSPRPPPVRGDGRRGRPDRRRGRADGRRGPRGGRRRGWRRCGRSSGAPPSDAERHPAAGRGGGSRRPAAGPGRDRPDAGHRAGGAAAGGRRGGRDPGAPGPATPRRAAPPSSPRCRPSSTGEPSLRAEVEAWGRSASRRNRPLVRPAAGRSPPPPVPRSAPVAVPVPAGAVTPADVGRSRTARLTTAPPLPYRPG